MITHKRIMYGYQQNQNVRRKIEFKNIYSQSKSKTQNHKNMNRRPRAGKQTENEK